MMHSYQHQQHQHQHQQSLPNPPPSHYDTRTAMPRSSSSNNHNHNNNVPCHHAANGNPNPDPNSIGNGAQHPSMPSMSLQMSGPPQARYYQSAALASLPAPHEPMPGNYYSSRPPTSTSRPLEGMGIMRGELAPLAPGTQPAADKPKVLSVVSEGRRYELFVVQQPIRARMCGFGDKDRRPITPPPCIRLVITDALTGKEIDCNDVDHGMFVINTDLWHENGRDEFNMVRHSNSSPSISSTTPVSYHDVPAAYPNILPQSSGFKAEPRQGRPPSSYSPYPGPPLVNPYSGPQGRSQPYYPSNYAPVTHGTAYSPQNGFSRPPGPPSSSSYHSSAAIHEYSHGQQVPPSPYARAQTTTTPQGMFTRNLIGSLAASAFRLTDPHDRIGIWFVLQDLSVRTEGRFRLRFSFVNVGIPASPINPGAPNTLTANKTSVPVLASCFSEPFDVYSAKRFPGVVESTPLSKIFATQGIKIPIRKEGPGRGDRRGENGEESTQDRLISSVV